MDRAHTVLSHGEFSSMVINDLNVFRAIDCPSETHPPLFVNPDAVLAFAVSSQRFQSVTGRRFQVIQYFCSFKHDEFAFSYRLDRSKPSGFTVSNRVLVSLHRKLLIMDGRL